jgi:hypothetical protein
LFLIRRGVDYYHFYLCIYVSIYESQSERSKRTTPRKFMKRGTRLTRVHNKLPQPHFLSKIEGLKVALVLKSLSLVGQKFFFEMVTLKLVLTNSF